jgi:hypothetical protein
MANKREFQFTGHAHKERQEETIKAKEIRDALMKCEILEDYPDDPRGASCLVLGYSEGSLPVSASSAARSTLLLMYQRRSTKV